MDIDDGLAASLPTPPRPSPARRAAAIGRALRSFDGASETEQSSAAVQPPARPTPWRRPYAGALVGVTLAVLIGMPVVWNSMQERGVTGNEGAPAVTDVQAEHAPPTADYAETEPTAIAMPPAASRQPLATPTTEADAAADAAQGPAPVMVAEAGPLPRAYAPAPAEKPEVQNIGRAESADAATEDRIVVTGLRSTARTQEALARVPGVSRVLVRGDWNACTVDDPGRSLSACRNMVDPAAKGATGRAAAHLADGLTLAWQGRLDEAVASFDRAIAAQPGSSLAYLNRGLAYRRMGDLDRALADLDRAIRHAPRAARGYYGRSLVLRQQGAVARAQGDERQAIALDPRYGAIVR